MNTAIRILATLRLTRLVTTDALGDIAVVQPARRWAGRHREWGQEYTWRDFTVDGLECPYCAPFWIGLVVLALPDNRLTRWVLGGLALNYLTGHISERLD